MFITYCNIFAACVTLEAYGFHNTRCLMNVLRDSIRIGVLSYEFMIHCNNCTTLGFIQRWQLVPHLSLYNTTELRPG